MRPNLGTIVRQSSLSYLGLLVQVAKNLGVLQFLAFVLSVAVAVVAVAVELECMCIENLQSPEVMQMQVGDFLVEEEDFLR